MGTSYHVKVITGRFYNSEKLKKLIAKRLEIINNSMSTYIIDSEISRFGRFKSTDKKFYISNDFLSVMKTAKKIYTLTGGAWDGTIRPLVHIWGFDSLQIQNTIPEKNKIDKLLLLVGFESIIISDDRYLKKKNAAVTLDLASIAKGYAIDQIVKIIRKNKLYNFIVEAGGEVYASGFRIDGKPWKVGINRPDKNAPLNEVYKTVPLTNKSLGTSGDYRNYFEINGKHFSHVLDPRTGYPVNNGVVSVSVIAEQCIFADGFATALMVLGHKKGLQLVNSLPSVECLFIVKGKDKTFTNYYSNGFPGAKIIRPVRVK